MIWRVTCPGVDCVKKGIERTASSWLEKLLFESAESKNEKVLMVVSVHISLILSNVRLHRD